MKRLTTLLVVVVLAILSIPIISADEPQRDPVFGGEIGSDSIILQFKGTITAAQTVKGNMVVYFEPEPGTELDMLTVKQLLERQAVKKELLGGSIAKKTTL